MVRKKNFFLKNLKKKRRRWKKFKNCSAGGGEWQPRVLQHSLKTAFTFSNTHGDNRNLQMRQAFKGSSSNIFQSFQI